MLKMNLKGITAEEMSFKMNKIKLQPNAKFEIKPAFSRQIQKIQENQAIHLVHLNVKIESTEAEPRPFNLYVSLLGVFEVEGATTPEAQRQFAIDATAVMYPYLRAAVSNLTADAFANPLMLPMLPGHILFPEDREEKTVSVNLPKLDGDLLN